MHRTCLQVYYSESEIQVAFTENKHSCVLAWANKIPYTVVLIHAKDFQFSGIGLEALNATVYLETNWPCCGACVI